MTGFFGAIADRTADGHIGGFDLNDEATVAVWFSSFQLLLISLCCWLNSFVDRTSIGAVGSRRFWRFGFYLFLIMSVDETGGLHEIFGKAMNIIFPALSISPSIWWTIPYALAIGFFLLFLLFKSIRQPTLLVILAAFTLSWFTANALEHIHVFDMSVNIAIEEGLEMFGATMLLLALSRVFIKEAGQLA